MKVNPKDGGFGALIDKLGTDEHRQIAFSKKPHKFHAVATEVDGHKFPSLAEASRYGELKVMQLAGKIRDLKMQVSHKLVVNGIQICLYRSDFEYEELEMHERDMSSDSWVRVVEDVKGVRTEAFAIKSRLMLACHGIVVHEVTKGKRK